MGRYVVRRLIETVVLVFVVSTIVAVFIHLIPGDPASLIVGDNQNTPDRIAAVRKNLGLDRPIYEQYLDWIAGIARGDFGTSLFSGREIRDDLVKRIPRTLELGGAALIVSIIIGIPLGVLAARYRNRPPDIIISSFAIAGLSIPVFVIGTLMVLLFSVRWQIFPASGYVSFGEDPVEHLKRLALPAITLGILSSATIMRMTRSSMLEVLGDDYVRTARAKGMHERTVVYGHALRNAMIPVITVVGLQIGTLLGGSVLVEYIFNWPGLSTYLITGINQRDYPVVQAVMLVIAVVFVLINLITDLLYGVIDPRIKYG